MSPGLGQEGQHSVGLRGTRGTERRAATVGTGLGLDRAGHALELGLPPTAAGFKAEEQHDRVWVCENRKAAGAAAGWGCCLAPAVVYWAWTGATGLDMGDSGRGLVAHGVWTKKRTESHNCKEHPGQGCVVLRLPSRRRERRGGWPVVSGGPGGTAQCQCKGESEARLQRSEGKVGSVEMDSE